LAVDVLEAHDGRRFLKHELTHRHELPLAKSLTDILSQKEDSRRYLRAYLDQITCWHAQLAPVLDGLRVLSSVQNFKEENVGVWVSSSGCETPLHFDLCHGFLVQCHGSKTFLLAPPSDTSCLYWSAASTAGSKNRTTSPVDLFAWIRGDASQQQLYPEVDGASFRVARLEPGLALYTPPGWWHAVVSESASVSVLAPFDPSGEIELRALPHNVQSV